MLRNRFFLLFFLGSILLQASGSSPEHNYPFILNHGQWNEKINYKIELKGTTIYYENNAIQYEFLDIPHKHPSGQVDDKLEVNGHIIRTTFVGSNPSVRKTQQEPSSFYHNYFLGKDRSKWKGKVHHYRQIHYHDLYDGIDMKSYSKEGQLKYDYIIAPNADASSIKLKYEGADQLTIEDGNLVIQHSLGKVVEQRPYAFQLNSRGEKVEIACEFQLNKKGLLTFHFPQGYERDKELIIDPVLIFSTYSGSPADNFGMTATYDREGSAYTAGIVYFQNRLYNTTPGAFSRSFGGGTIDIAISKFNPEGDSLIYATYLGGNGNETAHSLVVNDSLELYLLGATSSRNFPVTIGAYDSTFEVSNSFSTEIHSFTSGADAIVTKFSADGSSLVGSTYYGGNGVDGLNYIPGGNGYDATVFNYGDSHRGEIVLDSSGNCYIGTSSWSTNLNTINNISNDQDGLIVKFTTDLDSVIWARFHGGSSDDAIYSLKVIDNNRVLVGGGTNSYIDFPITSNSYQDIAAGGRTDGFISIISADGNNVEKSTFIGTSDYDQIYFIEFDRFNNIYGFGQSRGGLFPLKNTSIADTAAGQFFVKLDRNLDSLIYSTTFGDGKGIGEINISPTAFLVDRCQNVYASGWGGSLRGTEGDKDLTSTMPLTSDAFSQTTDNNDFYLYVSNANVDQIFYASYFGENGVDDHVDGGTSRFDKEGVIYQSVCASCGGRNSFPTKNAAFNNNASTNCNNAVFKLDFEILPKADFDVQQLDFCIDESENDSAEIRITNKSSRSDITRWIFGNDTIQTKFSDTTIFITEIGTFRIRQDIQDTICAAGDFLETVVTTRPDNIRLSTTPDTTVCNLDSINLTAFTKQNANFFIWSQEATLSNPFPSNDSAITIPLDPGLDTFYVEARNNISNACEKIDTIIINNITYSFDASMVEDTICENTEVAFTASITNIDQFQWNFDNGTTNDSSLNTTINYSSAGNYTITFYAENNSCPLDSSILNLRVEPNTLRFEPLSDTTQCGKDGFIVTKNTFGTASQYIWSSSPDFSDSLNSNLRDSTFFISEEDSAMFYLQISNQYCEAEDSLLVHFINYELDLETIPDSSCTPFSTELQTTIIGTDSFRIAYGNGSFTTTDSTPIVNYSNEGFYTINLIGSNQICDRRDTVSRSIRIFENVRLQSLNDTLFCREDTITLTANSFGTSDQFFWDTDNNFNSPINNPTDSIIEVSPTSPTYYYYRVVNGICSATDSLELIPDFVDVELDDLQSICLEDTLVVEARVINASSALNFAWTPQDSILSNPSSNPITLAPKGDFELSLISTNSLGCVDYDTMNIEVNIPAFTSAQINTSLDTVYKGQKVQFSTNRNGNNLVYFWEPEDDFNDPTSPSPELRIKDSTRYKVTILDLNTGCEVIAFKRLTVFEINCAEPDIFVPTAFTPNKDLSNDILYVRGANLEEVELKIYNRWGELVFQTNDKNSGWDGTYNGKEVDPGVFVYYLRAVCFDGQKFSKKGNISLIR